MIIKSLLWIICLFNKSVKPVNMKRTILICFMLLMLPMFSEAASVTMGVTFGNPQSNGGECVGKGVCREALDFDVASNNYLSQPDAVTVTFVVNSTNPNVLLMRFSLRELRKKQPDQVSSFLAPAGYFFESPYILNKPVFAPLSLPAGTIIAPFKSYSVMVSEDIVTMYIPFAS